VRVGSGAGVGQKPDDFFTISLCREHHAEQHRIGERSFAAAHWLNLGKLAEEFAKASPKALDIWAEKKERGL
jgi:hypothetical protein